MSYHYDMLAICLSLRSPKCCIQTAVLISPKLAVCMECTLYCCELLSLVMNVSFLRM